MDIISYILSKKYTDNTVDGLGAIKGAPCAVESVVDIDGGKRITLEWESNSGVKQTRSFDIMDGEDGANTVEWSQIQQSGTKIAEININGVSTDVYAPTGGGGTGDVADVEVNGTSVIDPVTKIAEITSYKEVTESEYEAIPVAERESNGIAYFIKDLNNESVQGYPPLIYSDEEREIGVWRDGKPLYQITIDQTIGSDADYTVFANGISNAHLVNSSFEYSNGRWMSFDYISLGATSNSRTCYVDVQNGALKLHNQTNQSMHWIATIQYTKTADVAGSGTWNGQGGIAHHYSTNETVIGTWIDGKPLYERAFLQTTFSANADTWYKTSIPKGSMKYLIDVFVVFENATTPSVHKGMAGGFVDDYLAINSFRNVGIDAGTTCYVVAQYTKTTD